MLAASTARVVSTRYANRRDPARRRSRMLRYVRECRTADRSRRRWLWLSESCLTVAFRAHGLRSGADEDLVERHAAAAG